VANKTLYQTLEDRGNPDEIESEGPFPCNRKSAWLGNGYYFWDTFISNAHWWGMEGAKYANGYIICKAESDFNAIECFDLVGVTEHILEFSRVIELMKKEGIYKKDTTVARVIFYWKDTLKIFKFKSIRAYGLKCKYPGSRFNSFILFNSNKPQYLDFSPAYQICFFERKDMRLASFKIVFPLEYMDGYAV
jgi:hypothetical protein